MALTHTPALLDHAGAPEETPRHRLPRQSRSGSPVLGVTAMAAALGATTGLTATAAAAATPASAPATAVIAPDESPAASAADPGLALAARIQQQADPRTAAEEAARLEAAQEAAAKRAAQAPQVQAPEAQAPQAPTEPAPPVEAAPPQGAQARLPVAKYTLTAPGSPWAQLNTGLDFAAPAGTPVVAVTGGTVSSAGWSGSYGYRVIQTLPDGTELWYCNLASITVTAGQVAPGTALGKVGATGSGTSPRLHLEVRPGGAAPVDPVAWLQAQGVTP
ncbi:M23 family metallopeptidase [Kitasatospora azatica]|uniref:M23 family metallopeptidase n=1 Tax=Kitasatospora azatica TaxID=58347 RepID=UPI00068E0CD7|nr:M23 family metallopeptidase [Kitasatospora azatica]